MWFAERSGRPEAWFQAAVTLRESILRDWVTLSDQERDEVRSYCLRYVLSHVPAPPNYVRAQLLATVACVLKRGWRERGPPGREKFFGEVEAAVAGAGSFSARCTGFQLMAAVVSEFAPGSAGAMAMPFEFHEQCRAEFEMQYLQHIFVKTVEQTRQVVATGAAQQGTDEGVCAAGLTLCNAILSWDFQRGGGAGASGAIGYIPDTAKTSQTESAVVNPGAHWRDVLLAPEAADWALGLQESLRGTTSPLLSSTRQMIIQLASLGVGIFPEGDQGIPHPTPLPPVCLFSSSLACPRAGALCVSPTIDPSSGAAEIDGQGGAGVARASQGLPRTSKWPTRRGLELGRSVGSPTWDDGGC
ncbi:hypothetical protein CYMTET_50979 [Cymbomonas tetramitiformis]|uniref:Exportin-4 n=1 Tax=Cymbomonas tetramitiformis TaxID=36881 RepID=A0AAE0BNZ2_9CHLO|nr:hypothetical protein CYMTET_50979 [Cymbomonas tetramitiformis]